MPKYRVKEGNSVRHGIEGSKQPAKEYDAGDILELTAEEAAEMPWAVEPADAKAGK
jgi:hypothetical protein